MTGWLRCTVQKGMFSDERAVTYPPASGGGEGAGPGCASSVFVPMSKVRGVPGTEGRVQVEVVRESGDDVWAVLPSAERPVICVNPGDVLQG